ncbi:MAG TPA: mobilization protein [Steroidobacteraceae bacterium]|nr:mobilization protein [Steroidobacteraceae bacterium]
MPKLDDQISTLQERLKQLKLRQQRVDARKRAIDTMRERKAETRRQFVVGSVILAKVQEGAMDPMQLRDWLDQTLTRRDDRALFHLPPKDEPPHDAMSTVAAPGELAQAGGAPTGK